MKKKAIVIHSGGMDSSICLALAAKEWGKENILSLSFLYQQRHSLEIEQAKRICFDWNIDHDTLDLSVLKKITDNALINSSTPINHIEGKAPNTLVLGRNGLMARLGAIYAQHLGADCIYMGIMELESSNSGYRDCSRAYMDLKQKILQIDLNHSTFEIKTPLVFLTKKQSLELAFELGVLEYLLTETISCYEEKRYFGCKICPACLLRNEGLRQFKVSYPNFILPNCFNP